VPVHIQCVGAGRHVAELADDGAHSIKHNDDLALSFYGTRRVVDIGYREPLDPFAKAVNRDPVMVEIPVIQMSWRISVLPVCTGSWVGGLSRLGDPELATPAFIVITMLPRADLCTNNDS